jgi:hypothetical protein
MNHSLYGADRLTHLKIVVVALIGGILVAGVGIAARGTADETSVVSLRSQGHGPVIRAGAPVVMVGGREDSTIR